MRVISASIPEPSNPSVDFERTALTVRAKSNYGHARFNVIQLGAKILRLSQYWVAICQWLAATSIELSRSSVVDVR